MNGARLLTAPGPGGVAVLRVEGTAALARLAALAGGRAVRPGEVRLVRLVRPSEGPAGSGAPAEPEDLDEALLVGVGEEPPVVELHLHGSPPLVDEVLQLLGGHGAPDGPRPEPFERRAEACLADVPTELGARVLVDQARGALRRALGALALLPPGARAARLAMLVARSDALRALLVPVRVVLSGPVNAGKSTLFNLLAGEARALVSPEPGTTRDALGADLALGPYALRLVDTAGTRPVHPGAHPEGDADAVERAGQEVARALVASADVVLDLARAEGGGPGPSGADADGNGVEAIRPTARAAVRPRRVRFLTFADLVYGADPAAWPPGVIAAAAAPAVTRARVLEALLAALELPLDPRWTPGEPVLTEDALRDAAQRAAEGGATDDVALARLRAALDT